MEIIRRFFTEPSGSFFLFGPRGTGKSTWLRQTYPDALFIDLLDPETYRLYLSHPERIYEVVRAHPEKRQIVIDEVQKVPDLLDVVHKIIEEEKHKKRKFILTGSSARKLKRTGVDMLAGRLVVKTMHPFMASELGNKFDLNKSLKTGMLPIVFASENQEETLKSYVTLYLKEEVQAEGLIRNVGAFSRFLEAISFSHGSQLNTSEVSRECQTGRKTVEGYVEILEDLMLGFRIYPFAKRAKRHILQHPKFYYMDTGVFLTLRPKGPFDSPETIGGSALEGLIAQHLRAWILYNRDEYKLYFWRTKSGLEVDFILYGERVLCAIEVKASKNVSKKDVRSLKTFCHDYPEAKTLLLYGGKDRIMIDGVLCVPVREFLLNLKPDSKIPFVE